MTRQTILFRSLTAIALVVLAAGPLPVDAQSRHGGGARPGGGGYHHGPGYVYRPGYWPGYRSGYRSGYWGPGLLWGGVGLGIGIGLGSAPYYGWPGYPGYVIADPPPVYYLPQPQPQAQPLPIPGERGAPDPVIYPRNGQSPAQTEADRQDCNRWATTVPSAMADASVFNRATGACMDGRGYTLR